MLVILAIAAIAILVCVVLVSLGKGGELTEFPPDVPALDLPEAGQLTAADVMAIHLPVNLVGYHTQSVDETLRRAAGAISARDNRIAVLEQRVSELLANRLYARQESHAAPGSEPRTEHAPEAPAVSRELPESGDPVTSSGASVSWDAAPRLSGPPEDPEWRVPGLHAQAAEAPDEPADETESDAESGERPDDRSGERPGGRSGERPGEPEPRSGEQPGEEADAAAEAETGDPTDAPTGGTTGGTDAEAGAAADGADDDKARQNGQAAQTGEKAEAAEEKDGVSVRAGAGGQEGDQGR